MAEGRFGHPSLHEGLLVHRLYLMSGTEVLYTSPANWKVISIDDEFLELIDLTVQSSFPYMADHLVLRIDTP
jgi:hypothetical protein